MDYKTSGVDIEAGREFVSEIKQAVEGTHTSNVIEGIGGCLLYTSPSPRDRQKSRMPSSA